MTLSIIRLVIGIIGIFSTTIGKSPISDYKKLDRSILRKFIFSTTCMLCALIISIIQQTLFFWAHLIIYLTFLIVQIYDFLEDLYISQFVIFSFDKHPIAHLLNRFFRVAFLLGIIAFLGSCCVGIYKVESYKREVVKVEYEVSNITDVASIEKLTKNELDLLYPVSSKDAESYLSLTHEGIIDIDEIKKSINSNDEGYLKEVTISVYYRYINMPEKYYDLYNWMNDTSPSRFSFYIID